MCNVRQNMANDRQNFRNNTVFAVLSYSQQRLTKWTLRIVKAFRSEPLLLKTRCHFCKSNFSKLLQPGKRRPTEF
jgi:hypothetical protein